jgi:hypothetical protein
VFLQVTDMLDRLYAKFDALADAHGVYKLETIGDGKPSHCGSTAVTVSPWVPGKRVGC